MFETLKSRKKINGFHRFCLNTLKNYPKKTESRIFRFKKRNVIPTYSERTVNRIQLVFVGVRVIPFDCLMVSKYRLG